MALITPINSKDNQFIKNFVKLGLDRRLRNESKRAVILGEHLLIEAHKYGLLDEVFVLESALHKYPWLTSLTQALHVHPVSAEAMLKLNLLETPCDCAAIIQQQTTPQLSVDFAGDCLVLERIQDPGNLGTLLRAARASGVQDVILLANSVDEYNPKVLRASQGIQFGLRLHHLAEFCEFLVNYPGQILALTPHAQQSLYDCDLTAPTALVLGNEGHGLSSQLLAQLSTRAAEIKIPMPGGSESLNLAMAATVALFEMSRQRLGANYPEGSK